MGRQNFQKSKQPGKGRNLRNAQRKLYRFESEGARPRHLRRLEIKIDRLQEVFDREW
jgi:hypothetical protein